MAIRPYQIGLKNHHIILKSTQFMMLMQLLLLVLKVGQKSLVAENFVQLETEYNQLNLGSKTLKKVLACHQ